MTEEESIVEEMRQALWGIHLTENGRMWEVHNGPQWLAAFRDYRDALNRFQLESARAAYDVAKRRMRGVGGVTLPELTSGGNVQSTRDLTSLLPQAPPAD